MKKHGIAVGLAAVWCVATGEPVRAQGSLSPPGTPAPTMKTLDQLEPRTAITNLPETVATAGSYYLTANLLGSSGNNGITISASDVTLDLNGFRLVGVGGSLDGILVSGSRAGIYAFGEGNRIEGNNVANNDRGIDVDGDDTLVIRNSADANTTNYDIEAGNHYGAIVDLTGSGTASVSGNSATNTVFSIDPWANFAL